MKLLFLIITSDDPIHIQDEETQRATWAKSELADAIWLRGGKATFLNLESRTLYVEVEDVYTRILQKTIFGVNWCVNNLEFDFLIRANVSTYFDIQRLKKSLSKYDSQSDFFGGHLDFARGSSSFTLNSMFVNGGALFLSQRTARRFREMYYEDWSNLPDDFAISQFLYKQKVEPTPMPRGNVANTGILTKRDYYRMKSSSNQDMATLRMKRIHQIRSETNASRKPIMYLLFYVSELKNFKRNFVNLTNYFLSVYSIVSSTTKSRKVIKRNYVE
jgi:hypothetical protein